MAGPVFIREKGRLRRLSERPPCGLAKPPGLPHGRLAVPQSQGHFVVTHTEAGGLRYSARPLFRVALLFVARNVQHLDSLAGFPEQVGELLFTAAVEERRLAPGALRLFSRAYGGLLLSSLCLRSRYLLLSERLDEIKIFKDLQSLDLYGCKLGDGHEILPHLASEALSSLTWLSLGDNFLTDDGVRKLTAPVRVMKRGLKCLKLLDLSYNPISEQAVRYLSCFPSLQGLDISGTKVQISVRVQQLLCDTMGLVLSEVPLKDLCHSHCKTQGWAEQLVKQWEVSMSEASNLRPSLQGEAVARFYGRKKFHHKAREGTSLEEERDNKVRIHLYKAAPSSRKMQQTSNPEDQGAPLSQSKRKREGGHPGLPGKRPAARLSEEDWELLNSY